MQRVTLVRYGVRAGEADVNEGLSRAVFDELRRVRPQGVGYGLFRDGDDFLHLFVNLEADEAEVVTGMESFRRYAEGVQARCAAPMAHERWSMSLVDAYGLGRVEKG
jgi:hypothetical protein